MIILYSFVALYVLFFGTWLFYVAFMHLKENKEILLNSNFLYYGLMPFFCVALIMDVLFNFIAGTIYFRELPKELLFTARAKRHLKGSGIQSIRAKLVCDKLLDPFDRGHCG